MVFAIQKVATTESGQRMMSGASSQSRISTSRLSGLVLAGVRLFKAVTQPANRDDAYAARLELLAQTVHVNLDRVGRDFLAPFAKMRHELVLGHEPASALQENLEQAYFARRQVERFAAEPRHPADLVIGERPVAQQRRTARHAAPNEGAHARFQFRKVKRFGEVVVGARVQPAHAVMYPVERREDQHGKARVSRAQALEDIES